jgi:putative transcriptional regulator
MASKTYNRIKAALAEKGKTNTWLAEKLDVNVNTVSKWCTNKMQPTVESLFNIAKVLDVDVRELLVSTK